MSNIMTIFTDQFFTALLVTVLILAGAAFAIAREKAMVFFIGLLRSFISILYSPYVYFKRELLNLINYGQSGESMFAIGKQYLLNKFILTLQAVVLVMAGAILAGGLISGWNNFLPPRALRDELAAAKERLSTSNRDYDQLTTKVKNWENEWAEKKESLINAFRAERQSKIDRAKADNVAIENKANGDPVIAAIFPGIKTFLEQNESSEFQSSYDYTKNQCYQLIDSQPIADDVKTMLKQYVDNWVVQKTMYLELKNLSDRALRQNIQPEYESTKEQINNLTREINSQAQEVTSLGERAKYDFGALVSNIVVAILEVIGFLWITGLIIELLGLSIDLATNVSKIHLLLKRDELTGKESNL